MKIPLLYEHQDFVIAHKSAGQLVHGAENSIIYSLQQALNLDTPLDPVHRLDKGTTGVIILSKNKSATAYLSQLFEKRQVSKVYIAITGNKVKKKHGKIIGDMVKSRNGSYKLLREAKAPAITYFSSCSIMEGKRLFVLLPKTGKTHQLRVALKSNSSPILGDSRYGSELIDRMYLHAYSLKFEYMGNEINCSSTILEGKHWPNIEIIEDQIRETLDNRFGNI